MAQLYEQLRLVFRRLGRAPLFTSITLLTLAIGIGANTVIFSVIEGVLLKPLDYPQPDRLVGVWHKAPGIGLQQLPVAPYLYFIYREQSKTLEDIGVYQNSALNITGDGQPQHVKAFQVTDGLLPILGVKPILGRLFTRNDDSPGAPQTTLISYGYWLQRYSANSSVIGRTIIVDGKPREIIGVLPKKFHLLDEEDAALIVPMQLDRSKTKLGSFDGNAMARLKSGVSLAQAQADLSRLVSVANRSFPAPEGFSASLFEKAQIQTDLHTSKSDVIGDIGGVLWVLMGSIAIVLLVACANVANLLLVRVEGRRQELAIRAALGAGYAHAAGGILFESIVLGFAGSILGLGIAYGALRVLLAMAPTGLPRLHEIGIDVPVLMFTLGLALLVSFLIGLIPVLKYAGPSLYSGLREGGRALSQSRERHRARKALVVLQVALALVLLICSGLMIRTFHALTRVAPGFSDPNSVQIFGAFIPDTRVPDTDTPGVVRLQQQMRDRIAAIPGVTSVAFSSAIPMNGSRMFNPLLTEDHVVKDGEVLPMRRFKFVSPGFLKTIGTSLLAGRDLSWEDTYQNRHVAIVSETLARENWHNAANALGKRVRVGSTDDWNEVVGVAADTSDDGVDKPATATVYWPIVVENFMGNKVFVRRFVWFAVRASRAGSADFMNEIQSAIWSVDANIPLADPTTLGRLYTRSMARTSFTLVMLCVAGSMALMLGVIGIYGVISYAVSQRTRESGIRMALGAQRDQLTGMFVRQGLTLTFTGVILGLATAFMAVRFMSSLLFNVSPIDPGTYCGMTAIILGIAWLACYLPSRRAAAVEPVTALRAE